MKATKILICILCCTWICSCSLLEVDPVSTITSQSFWKTSGDAKAYLTGIYNKVRDLNNTVKTGEMLLKPVRSALRVWHGPILCLRAMLLLIVRLIISFITPIFFSIKLKV
jgi:hypothetical protein